MRTKTKKIIFLIIILCLVAPFLSSCTVGLCWLKTDTTGKYPIVHLGSCHLLYQSQPIEPYYIYYRMEKPSSLR